MKVSLILPTMNEVEGLKWLMPQLDPTWYDQLIIMDGGSRDGTQEFCREHGYPIYQQRERGLPPALAEALALVTGDIIVTVSPDGNCLPRHIPELIAKMREGKWDMVIVSRYKGAARSEDDDTVTGLGNKAFTKTVNTLFRGRYTDTLGIFRAYTADALRRMRLATQHREYWLRRRFVNMNSWDLGSSIRGARLRLRVTELSGDEPKRIGGARKLSIWNNGMGAVFQILDEFIRRPQLGYRRADAAASRARARTART